MVLGPGCDSDSNFKAIARVSNTNQLSLLNILIDVEKLTASKLNPKIGVVIAPEETALIMDPSCFKKTHHT